MECDILVECKPSSLGVVVSSGRHWDRDGTKANVFKRRTLDGKKKVKQYWILVISHDFPKRTRSSANSIRNRILITNIVTLLVCRTLIHETLNVTLTQKIHHPPVMRTLHGSEPREVVCMSNVMAMLLKRAKA